MVHVNIKGILFGIAAVLPTKREQQSGHIISVSSVEAIPFMLLCCLIGNRKMIWLRQFIRKFMRCCIKWNRCLKKMEVSGLKCKTS
ncbi:hypothetical protein A8708_16585 [Paenibacillus oryzisoli]|uniref:Uncharacterized protein n=1 Tax=Paenibacillus oryzisoli TaxID=1850517 RepID=A0A198AKD6_9BACL|nr:hypothetical protein A8708_16585 [Paenibacillus oryzisoli]